MFKYGTLFLSFLIMLVCTSSNAGEITHIEVMALFKDKAMVSINDKQHLLKVGEVNPTGVKLLQATSKYALLEVNGKQAKYTLGNRVHATYSKSEKKKVDIYSDGKGMFKTIGSINGFTVYFLVDTGASVVAINSSLAKRLGIQYKLKGEETVVATASGRAFAYSVNLDQVKVGEIMLRNIDAVIIEGDDPSTPLLGMSYLGRLNINNQGQIMSLEEKY